MVATPGDPAPEPVGELVGPPLGPGEDDALAGLVAVEQVDQEVELPVVLDGDVVLLDRLDRRLVLREVHLDRLEHVAAGERPDLVADRGREQQGLVRVGHLAEDPLDVGPEPDVEHPVGLVEDDVEDLAEVERPPLDVVEHPAGRADDDVDAPLQGPELLLDRLAAVDPADRDVLAVGQLLHLDDDLLDQLAGRRQDDGLGALAPGFEHLDQGDAEGGRLAGAGLGLADDVPAVEGLGDQGGLDRGGGRVADPPEGFEHRAAQAHRMESGWGFLHRALDQTNLLGVMCRMGDGGSGRRDAAIRSHRHHTPMLARPSKPAVPDSSAPTGFAPIGDGRSGRVGRGRTAACRAAGRSATLEAGELGP